MGVWASAGSLSRASSELGLLNVEQQRMLRNQNQLTATKMSETDARAAESEDETQKVADKTAKKISADLTQTAADLRIASAIFALVGTLNSSFNHGSNTEGKTNWAKAIPAVTNGMFAVFNAIMEANKAKEEADAIGEELGRVKADKKGSNKGVRALDANPYT